MNLCSSKLFISVFLSAAPPRLFQTQTFEREVEVEPGCGRLSPQAKSRAQSRELTKDPEDFSSIHTASGSSHNTSRALPQDPSSWFSYAQPFLKHYASL